MRKHQYHTNRLYVVFFESAKIRVFLESESKFIFITGKILRQICDAMKERKKTIFLLFLSGGDD